MKTWYVCWALLSMTFLGACNNVSLNYGPKSMEIVAPSQMLTGHCTEWQVKLDKPATKETQIALSLTSNGSALPGAEIFSDASCTMPVSSLSIGRKSSSAKVYTKYNKIGSLTLTASGFGSKAVSLNTSMDFTKLEILAGARTSNGLVEGFGTDARMPGPAGITTDGTYLYMAHFWFQVITRIHIATGEFTLLAGELNTIGSTDGIGPAARFNRPQGLAVHNGFLYVSDRSNHVIRQINLTTSVVTTVAGQAGVAGGVDGIGSAATFTDPLGLTSDGTYLYVAEHAGRTIRRIDPTNFNVITLAGASGVSAAVDGPGTTARFPGPAHISNDGTYVYIADWTGHTIRRMEIAPPHNVTTLAGSGSPGATNGVGTAATFRNPYSVKVSGGYLYIADPTNQMIRQLDLATNAVTTLTGSDDGLHTFVAGPLSSSRYSEPIDIVFNGPDMYVAEFRNNLVRRIDLTAQTSEVVAGLGVDKPFASLDGVGKAAKIDYTEAFATDGTYLYIGECGAKIKRMHIATTVIDTIAGNGTSSSVDGTGTAATFDCPQGMVYHSGHLYITENTHIIRKMNVSTGVVTTFAGLAGSAGGADGIGSAARFNDPESLAVYGNKLYVADMRGHTIREIDLTTAAVTTVAGSYNVTGDIDGVGTSARFNWPNAITILGNDLYITTDSSTLRKMNLTTYAVTTVVGLANSTGFVDGVGTSARMYFPYGVTNDANYVYIADSSNNAIRRYDPVTDQVTTLNGLGRTIAGDMDGDIPNTPMTWISVIFWTPHGLFFSNDGVNVGWIH